MDYKKKICIVFLGNIHYDSRATNFYNSFSERGYKVSVISFDWLTKEFKTERGDVSVIKLKKRAISIGFYLKFAFILSLRLLFEKADYILAEDVYTLPFAVLFSKIKRTKVLYDSREIYGHLAGLKKKKNIQAFWRLVEEKCIDKVDIVMTTGELDSEYIEKEYNLEGTIVIRNLPFPVEIKEAFDFRNHFNLDKSKKILLYQGVILHGRGLKEIFDIFSELKNCVLIILGGGEQKEYYQELAREKNIAKDVFFFGKVNQNELFKYTSGADIGLAIIENLSFSYYLALPNKMFEYIYCGVPVFVSNFPQMKSIVDKYNVGVYIDPDNKPEIISRLNNLLDDVELRNKLKENCSIAARELNWSEEIKKLFNLL
ncbi:MAG: glycosyltransferase [Ignavibacteriaceae bacterium]|nr:glycosyltransferase [Ignavibacteriaceae bacterium]